MPDRLVPAHAGTTSRAHSEWLHPADQQPRSLVETYKSNRCGAGYSKRQLASVSFWGRTLYGSTAVRRVPRLLGNRTPSSEDAEPAAIEIVDQVSKAAEHTNSAIREIEAEIQDELTDRWPISAPG